MRNSQHASRKKDRKGFVSFMEPDDDGGRKDNSFMERVSQDL